MPPFGYDNDEGQGALSIKTAAGSLLWVVKKVWSGVNNGLLHPNKAVRLQSFRIIELRGKQGINYAKAAKNNSIFLDLPLIAL